MEQYKRACVAYIIGLTERNNISSVFEYETGAFHLYSSTGNENNIQVFDFQRNNMITGSMSSLYDFSTNSFISITRNGKSFTGYDFASNCFFSALLNGNIITIFDTEDNRYHTYLI